MSNILVVTIHDWNLKKYQMWKPPKGYRKFLISKKEDLTLGKVEKIKPDFIFFPHWSWIIPNEIYKKFNCVVFHMTNVPYGRGGTPLQNLLSRGIYKTKISAIKVNSRIDAGPVFLKKDFSIKQGSASEIYKRASILAFKMMDEIIIKNPKPVAQKGKAVVFKRRLPFQSELPKNLNLKQLHDYIRMLDADDYPRAFFKMGNFLFEFSQSKISNGKISAKVEISAIKTNEK